MNTLHETHCNSDVTEFSPPKKTKKKPIINGTFRQQFLFIRSVLKHLRSYSKDTRNIPSEPYGKDRAACCQYFLVYKYGSESSIEFMFEFMFDGFYPQTSHDFLYNKRLLGFSFWFQALKRVNCCRQSEVMSQISFTRRCFPFVVHGCIEETLFKFLYIFNV